MKAELKSHQATNIGCAFTVYPIYMETIFTRPPGGCGPHNVVCKCYGKLNYLVHVTENTIAVNNSLPGVKLRHQTEWRDLVNMCQLYWGNRHVTCVNVTCVTCVNVTCVSCTETTVTWFMLNIWATLGFYDNHTSSVCNDGWSHDSDNTLRTAL